MSPIQACFTDTHKTQGHLNLKVLLNSRFSPKTHATYQLKTRFPKDLVNIEYDNPFLSNMIFPCELKHFSDKLKLAENSVDSINSIGGRSKLRRFPHTVPHSVQLLLRS